MLSCSSRLLPSNHALHIPHSTVHIVGSAVLNWYGSYYLGIFQADLVSTIHSDDHPEPDRWCGISALYGLVDCQGIRMSMTRNYERIAGRLLRVNYPRPKAFCVFKNGRPVVGTQSLHRTAAARIWRTFWRIKLVRPKQ